MTPASGPEPRPVADVDKGLREALEQFHRVRWALVVAAGLLLSGAVAFLIITGHVRDQELARTRHAAAQLHRQISRDERSLHASCGFFRGIAGLDVQPAPPVARPNQALVNIVAGSRSAFTGEGCGPPLPPASPSLRHWAGYYHIPLR